MEFSNELLGALYIADRAPFIFFNTIALPVYLVSIVDFRAPVSSSNQVHNNWPET